MPYTPINSDIFSAAFAGAIGGIVSMQSLSDPIAADYSARIAAAAAFAQEVDTIINTPATQTSVILQAISQLSEGVLITHSPQSIIPTDYAQQAGAIAAIVSATNTFNAANITPSSATGTASSLRARAVAPAGNSSLTAFIVAGNDGVTLIAGDTVLLTSQTLPADNGPWIVGLVTGGTAPLTRPTNFGTGSTQRSGGLEIQVGGEGTVFKNTRWRPMIATDSFVVGTSDGRFYPQMVSGQSVLVAGTFAITTVPIFSELTNILFNRYTGNTPALTVQYAGTVANVNGIVPGVLGVGSITVQATVAAGTINAADISTVDWTIINQAA